MEINTSVRSTVGENVKRLRESSGKSVVDIAAAVGVDRTYWYLLEAGDVNFTIEKLEKAAAVFGVSVRDLLTEPSKSSKGRKTA